MAMDAIPRDLLCPLCKGVIHDAVMSPCCAIDICEDCGRSGIILGNGKCPLEGCNETAHLEDLIPNRLLRKKAAEFRTLHPDLVEKVNRIPPPSISELLPRPEADTTDNLPDSPGPVFQTGVCITDDNDKPENVENGQEIPETVTSDTSLNLHDDEDGSSVDAQQVEKSCDIKEVEFSDDISSTTKAVETEDVLKTKKKKKKKDKHSGSKSPEKDDLSSSKNSKTKGKSKGAKSEETSEEPPAPGEEKPATETGINHKLEIAPNLLQEAGTDPLSVFNKLMAAKDKDKGLINPGASIHYGVPAPQSIPTYAGGIYYPPPPLGYYPGTGPHYSMYMRASQPHYPYQDRSRTVQNRTYRSRSSYERRHYDDKQSSSYRRDVDKRRDTRKSKSPKEYTPPKKISRTSTSGSGSSRSSSSSSSSSESEKKKDKSKTSKKQTKTKDKESKTKKSDKSPARTSKLHDDVSGKSSRGRREDSPDKDKYRSSRRSRSRSRDTSRRRRSWSRERARKRDRSYSQENGRRHRNRSSDGERGRSRERGHSGSRDRQIRSRSREGTYKDNSRSRHRSKSHDRSARSAAYDKVSKILKTLVKYKESEHKESKKEKKRSKKDKKEKLSKEIKSPTKEAHHSPRPSSERLETADAQDDAELHQEHISDEVKDVGVQGQDRLTETWPKENSEDLEAVHKDTQDLVAESKISEPENDPVTSSSGEVGMEGPGPTQPRSQSKPRTSSAERSSDSDSVSEHGSFKDVGLKNEPVKKASKSSEAEQAKEVIHTNLETSLKKFKDFVESDVAASPIKASKKEEKFSASKVSDEESTDERFDSRGSKRDISEGRQSDLSTKSDQKVRRSKSMSKEKEDRSSKKSGEKQASGPSSSERLKVAQRLMSKVREASLELYHDDDFRILIEDFIRPPKSDPEVCKKKRAKKRSFGSESDGSSGRSVKEQPKKKMKVKKEKKKKKKKRSTASSEDEISSPSFSRGREKDSKIGSSKQKNRETSPKVSYQNGS